MLDSDELAAIVDFHFYPLDISPAIIGSHQQNCTGLAKEETNCNYIADQANLCVQQHSKQRANFTECMFRQALQGDERNPLAARGTFDGQLADCAATLEDYSVDELRSCAYSDEAVQLRASNRDTIADIFSDLNMSAGLVWASVDGNLVSGATEDTTSSREDWQHDLVTAVCDAYTGVKPEACVTPRALVV